MPVIVVGVGRVENRAQHLQIVEPRGDGVAAEVDVSDPGDDNPNRTRVLRFRTTAGFDGAQTT